MGDEAEDGVWAGVSSSPLGKSLGSEKMWMMDLTRRILVQTGCFLDSSPKAGLNGVPTVKITLGTPFPGVPAGNDPCTPPRFTCAP